MLLLPVLDTVDGGFKEVDDSIVDELEGGSDDETEEYEDQVVSTDDED